MSIAWEGGQFMIQKIAENLMIRVYYDFSAVVSLDAKGNVTGVSLFDTEFGGRWMHAEPDAAQIWLMIHHPDGNRQLTQKDLENIAALREAKPFIPLRVFIAGEDIGVTEAVLSVQSNL